MHMRTPKFTTFLAVSALALPLAACGSSGETTASPSPSSPDSSSASTVATSAAPAASPTPSHPASSAPSASTSSKPAASTATPAAEGTVIAAMSGRDFPQEVNDWTLDKQSDSSIHTYSSAGRKMGVEFRTSSVYDQRVADLSDAVPAGTGKCGTPSTSKNSIVCFLKTEDGLVQATADSTKVTQEEIVSFANELTTLLGTA